MVDVPGGTARLAGAGVLRLGVEVVGHKPHRSRSACDDATRTAPLCPESAPCAVSLGRRANSKTHSGEGRGLGFVTIRPAQHGGWRTFHLGRLELGQ